MKVLTFGEVMLRLKTPEHLKILQADTFEAITAARRRMLRFPWRHSGTMFRT